jgi:hypothetical protein
MEKSYKTNKHINKLHILHQNAKKKINILKMDYNKKKKGSFAYLIWQVLKKKIEPELRC